LFGYHEAVWLPMRGGQTKAARHAQWTPLEEIENKKTFSALTKCQRTHRIDDPQVMRLVSLQREPKQDSRET